MIQNNNDILPPHPIVELSLPLETYVRGGILTLLALIVGLFVVWLFWLRYRKRFKEETVFEKSMKALKDVWVRSSGMNDREFAFATSDCVRNYLETALNLPAPERTTEEFLLSMNQHPVFQSHDIAYLLKQILEKCDEAKFAKRRFTEKEKSELYQYAEDLIEQLYEKTQQKIERLEK